MSNITVIDADSHVWEPTEIWTDRVPADQRALIEDAFWHERGPAGTELTVVNGREVRSLNRSRLNRLACYHPGDSPDSIGALDPSGDAAENPGAWDPAARLADLDALGIAQQIVFPTLFAEHLPVVESPRAAVVLARAYNEWVADFAAAGEGRLHPVAVLPLQSLPGTLEEIERAAAAGFRAVFVRPSFVRGRFINHSEYDPMWRAISDAGLVACIHPSTGSTNPDFTSAGAFVERVASNLEIGHDVAGAIAPVQDNMSAVLALAYYGHLESNPTLKLALCHAGASWFELALEKAETYLWLFPGPLPVSLEPEELWRQHDALVTFDAWEDSVGILPGVYGTMAAYGTRYPHHDASAPAEATGMLERNGVKPAVIADMMGGNAAKLYGLSPIA
ncbi:MAG: amidohydrolase family protein [Myxococcales bacterium]|nr:amidohydrolase family protein [Myxococcales bacterium]